MTAVRREFRVSPAAAVVLSQYGLDDMGKRPWHPRSFWGPYGETGHKNRVRAGQSSEVQPVPTITKHWNPGHGACPGRAPSGARVEPASLGCLAAPVDPLRRALPGEAEPGAARAGRRAAQRLFRPVASPGAVFKVGRLAGLWRVKKGWRLRSLSRGSGGSRVVGSRRGAARRPICAAMRPHGPRNQSPGGRDHRVAREAHARPPGSNPEPGRVRAAPRQRDGPPSPSGPAP